MKIGCYVGRFIFGTATIIFVGGSLNSFAYLDVDAARGSFAIWVLEMFPMGIVTAFVFYCLGEYAGLRDSNREGADQDRVRRDQARRHRTNAQMAGITLFFLITGIFGVLVAWRECSMVRSH